MSRKTHKFLVFFIATVLVVVAFNLFTASAYRGINPRICKELSRLFAQNPSLLVNKEYQRLGDCVNFYKAISVALKPTTLEILEVPKAKRFESPPKNYLKKSF
jgi:hypothetical protein